MCPEGGAEGQACCPGEEDGQGTGCLQGLSSSKATKAVSACAITPLAPLTTLKQNLMAFTILEEFFLHVQRYSVIIPLSCSAVHVENAGFGDSFHLRVLLLSLMVPKCAVVLQKIAPGQVSAGSAADCNKVY